MLNNGKFTQPSTPRSRWLAMSASALLGTLPTAAMAQATHTVGVGQTHATIAAAVAIAQHGDTVLVIGGVHADDLLITRGIRLIGRGARFTSTSGFFDPRIQVVDLPAGRSFAISGFELLPESPGSLIQSRRVVSVVNCAGSVTIENLTDSGAYARWTPSVSNSAQVSIRSCRLGAMGLQNSLTVVENCNLRVPSVSLFATLWIEGGTTVLVGGQCSGATGSFSTPGVQLDSGRLVVTRSTIRSGPATQLSSNVPAITVLGGEVWLDPSALLIPAGTAPAVQGIVPQVREIGSTIATLTQPHLSLHSHGPANTYFATMLSLPVALTPTPWGTAWVDPAASATVVIAAYGADRQHTYVAPLPTLPPGLIVTLQPIVLGSPEFFLGAPTVLTTM